MSPPPSWSLEDGTDMFGKLECKRCLSLFITDVDGEIPEHQCIGGIYKSVTDFRISDMCHTPVLVRKSR